MEKGEISLNDIDSEKLHEHFSFKVDIGQNPLRIDKFLMLRIENATRNKIQKAALNGSIRVNDLHVNTSYKVKGGEVIKVLFNRPPHENLLIPEKMKIDVVYEDDDLIVVNKPPNIVVHPGHGNYSGTLINGLLYHFERLPKNSIIQYKQSFALVKDSNSQFLEIVSPKDGILLLNDTDIKKE